jgi:hypothetical protein
MKIMCTGEVTVCEITALLTVFVFCFSSSFVLLLLQYQIFRVCPVLTLILQPTQPKWHHGNLKEHWPVKICTASIYVQRPLLITSCGISVHEVVFLHMYVLLIIQ